LNIILTVYYEQIPIAGDSSVNLTRNSAPYDPRALEILSMLLQKLAVGDVATANSLGTWFSNLFGFIADIGKPVGEALGSFIPGAQIAGNAISGASRVMQGGVKRFI